MKFKLISAALALGLTLPIAQAQIPVTDSISVAQQILIQARALQSNINEQLMLAQQINMVANQIRNLQNLPAGIANSLLGEYATLFSQYISTFNTINGLASNVASLSARFTALFPDRASSAGPLSPASIMAQVQAWLTQSRRTNEGVYRTSGQVIQNLPQAQAQMNTILSASQSASGVLDATQANTQMNAQVATQIMMLNTQMASWMQADTDWKAQQGQMIDDAGKIVKDAGANYYTPSTAIPLAGRPAFN